MNKKELLPYRIDQWDSLFFKTRIARIKLQGNKKYPALHKRLVKTISCLGRNKARFLIIRLDFPNSYHEVILRKGGLKKCDEAVIFFLDCRKYVPSLPEGIRVKLCSVKDLIDICRIAEKAFFLSYLYKCGFSLSSTVDRYHSVWVVNSYKDKSSKIFVVWEKNKAVGFVILKFNKEARVAKIILIAVDKKFQRKGLGEVLVNKAIQWSRKQDIKFMFVRTQKKNKNALLFYKRLGFKTKGYDKTFFRRIT